MAIIKRFDFNKDSLENVSSLKYDQLSIGEGWPVVYVINDDAEAYVGQTINFSNRASQHLANNKKSHLTEIRIITDEDYNVSVALDLESFLIQHMDADTKFRLINGNDGIKDHDYYNRDHYEASFESLWEQLRKKGLAKQSIREIENSNLYKYSPYKSLGDEQFDALKAILKTLAERRDSRSSATIVVRGGAGTGKTILAIYLMKLLADANNEVLELSEEDEDYNYDGMSLIRYASEEIAHMDKMGIVFPQKSLRTSVKDVFSNISSLSPDMVLDTGDVVKNYIEGSVKYDLLIVDEGHRLKSRKRGGNMLQNAAFNRNCEALGLDSDKDSELDWIIKCSRNQIIFRDERQTVRAADMDTEEFNKTISKKYGRPPLEIALTEQWRCDGGTDYTDYVKSIFDGTAQTRKTVENYDFKLYDDVDDMVKDIKELDKQYELCRVAAGYAWKWNSKNDKKAYDIEIDGYKYRWNSTYDNWICSKNAVNEIGCIHTVQGYDLNYLGVIIGEDIKYDKDKKCIVSDISNYYDGLGKTGLTRDLEALRDYLVNIYTTLMTRGIKGTYVYVCDSALKEYMAQFIEKA